MFQNSPQLSKAVVLNPATVFDLSHATAGTFDYSNIGADGIYGYAGSTAEALAAAKGYPFHLLEILTFDVQGGSDVPVHYQKAGDVIPQPTPTKDGCAFGGWYGTAACDGAAITFPHTMSGDETMFAKWTPLITQQTSSIYVGGRDTFTPNVTGGTWLFDSAFVSLEDNGDGSVTITGVQEGTTTITYSAGGATDTIDVTIDQSNMPPTGQDFTWALLLGIIGAAASAAALVARRRKQTA